MQRRLFEKRKFVLRTDYLCPVQNVPRPLWKEICTNKRQLAEWVNLYALGKDGAGDDLSAFKGKLTESFLEKHPTLVVNTALFDEKFPDFKWRLLETFDNLDSVLDGVLVKADNFQALQLMQRKLRRAWTLATMIPRTTPGRTSSTRTLPEIELVGVYGGAH